MLEVTSFAQVIAELEQPHIALSPVSPVFSTHERKEGEPGIQNHMHDVDSYTRIGRVADRENCMWARTILSSLVQCE